MSSIAVFLVLGGGAAFAASKIGTSQIKAGAITTGKIKKEAVAKGKIKNGAVANSKLAEGAVTGNKIAAGTVSRGNLAEGKLLPRAYALVGFSGVVEPGFTEGIPNATTPVEGTYCFDLSFTPVHAQATGEADSEGNDMPSVSLAGTEIGLINCPAGTDVEVEMWDTGLDEETTEEFFLVVW